MRWSAEVEQADWIGPRLDGFLEGLVTSTVPRGFPAYVRVLHPVEVANLPQSRDDQPHDDQPRDDQPRDDQPHDDQPRDDGPRDDRPREGPVRWAEVAAWSGVELTPQTPFRVIATPAREPTSPAPWTAGQGPADGTLEEPDASVLLEVLAAHTAPGMRCWFAVWDGYGWDNTLRFVIVAAPDAHIPEPYTLPDIVPSEVRAGPRVQLPCRSYLLLTGEVGDALALVEEKGQTPNLWWPQDRSWCVATEIDDDVTYVAGSRKLVDALHADPRLETQPAGEGEPALARPAR